MEGPGFSTRAESNLHRTLGADVVGMTAMPEARLAREAELAYALLALPTDWDKLGADVDSVLEHVLANLEQATTAALALLRSALSDPTALQSEASPAHTALDLAVFTDPTCIDDEERQRLKPLWGRVL